MRAFGERYADFRDAGAVVVGVSADSCECHRLFRQQLGLNFPLLCDSGKEIANIYKARRFLQWVSFWTTYVIDKDGIIRSIIANPLRFDWHSRGALAVIYELMVAPATGEPPLGTTG